MLLGRDRELEAVDQALSAARSGRSARLVIRGEPGIGKTALLDHALAVGSDMTVLAARGVEFEADVPFAGLHELLRPALDLVDRLPTLHASALRSSLGLGERIEADRLIVGAAVLALISACAERGPLLVVVDDAHWLDRASSEAIGFAARRLVADPVAVLIALREGEDSPLLTAGLPELRLGGLDAGSAAELLRTSGDADFPSEAVERLLRTTGGNPLALLELGRAGPHRAASPHDDLPIATSVERAYLRRAEGLTDGAMRVLLLMAASGPADLDIVQRAAETMGVRQAEIDQAESASGVVDLRGDRIEFVHPLARAAVYHSASPAGRRAAHRALAAVMSDPDDVDRRAWHLAAAASGWNAEAATALEQAARRARESTGYDAAAGALAESARLTEDVELRADRLFRAAENAWLAGRAERAVELLASARNHTRRPRLLVEISSLSGHIAMRRGAVAEGSRILVAAAETIEGTDRLKAIHMLADAALSSFGAGNPDELLGPARKAYDLLRAGDPPDHAAIAHVAYGAISILAGHGSEGARLLHESVPLFESAGPDNVDSLFLLSEGIAGLFIREAEVGRALLERALIGARQHAPTAALPVVLFILGRDAAATDRWALARAQYEESARIARETTQSTWLAGSAAGLAWLDALEGREEECRAHALEAAQLAEQYGMGLYAVWSAIALGQLELGLGRPEAALEHFERCERLLKDIAIDDPDLSPAPDIVDVLVRLGRMPEARAVSLEYEESARSKGQPFALARAARARGLVAGDGEFAAHYEEALRRHAATPDVFEQARTELYFGERLRRARKRVDARTHLRSALKAFDQLGAAPWGERALGELQASGETARVREDTYRQQLTPQELQVALTLAEGATTREAAARLYLSPKTVEYHLRHVYDKLEIRTRDELRSVLMKQDRPSGSRKVLMFTDLVGSTSLVEAIGDDAWHNLSAWMDGELRRLFAEHRGREVDHAGDGFFVVFDAAADAIACAVEIQRRMQSQRRLHGFAPQLRIGIHEGDVNAAQDSLRGASVHRAARLCAAAAPDTILVSRTALEGAGRPITGIRRLALKGIKEPVEAAEVRWDR